MDAKKNYTQATKIVEAKLDFYKSLGAYILITGALVTYNFYNAGQITWSRWVILGWGAGLLIQWQSAFVENATFDRKLKERMIQKELRKLS